MTRRKRDYLREANVAERAARAKAAKHRRRRRKREVSKPDAKERQPGLIRIRGTKKAGDSRHVHTKPGHFKQRKSKENPKDAAVVYVQIKSKFILD